MSRDKKAVGPDARAALLLAAIVVATAVGRAMIAHPRGVEELAGALIVSALAATATVLLGLGLFRLWRNR